MCCGKPHHPLCRPPHGFVDHLMDCNPHPEPWMPGINKHSENDGPAGVLELRSITARDLTRVWAAARRTKPISAAWHWRRPHDVRRCCGASLWSGYVLPTRRPTAAINGDNGQGNHLSEPKRCSDKPGHLTQAAKLDALLALDPAVNMTSFAWLKAGPIAPKADHGRRLARSVEAGP